MKVLVAAASKHGATAEICRAIGKTLADRGLDVAVSRAEDVNDLAGFGAVVLGSGVYAGQWLKPAKEFVERYAEDLTDLPVWLFSSGPLGDPPQPEEDMVEIAPIISAVDPQEHRVFAGKLVKNELGFAERAIAAAVRAPEGDFPGLGGDRQLGRLDRRRTPF